ncbi:hypothetical protein [Pseudomonas sp. Gutcm_11s]|uniref:hypothetical protein n=1 Tax=Pseudomonas sp. Gutcm_11s TaxID=3026088 RepID=UPI0023617417|nr:hypothetical protein [Pseudomonas sp. Gutcm_11s]MDD0842049.1 hypothetical protein [Pseudomonas sp. Gutcm_11s]
MSRLALALAVFVLSLSGCAVYGDDYGYDRPGYNVRYYESYSSPRVYYYDDDRDYRWHRDRYQDRRHSHYAPGYDGRYKWHDNNRNRYDGRRDHDRDRYRGNGREQPRYGWDQRSRDHDRRQIGQLRNSDRGLHMHREVNRGQRQESGSHKQRRQGWGERR